MAQPSASNGSPAGTSPLPPFEPRSGVRYSRSAAAMARFGGCVLAGILYGVCFPPMQLKALAWVALVPLLIALRNTTRREALGLGAVFATTGTYVTVDWLPRTIATYYAQPLPIGIALFLGVMVFTVMPYVVAFAAWYRSAGERYGAALPLLTGAAWVTAEIGRSTLLIGNPWVLFGYAQFGVDRVVQIADVTGVYGISFALVAVNAAIADWCAALADRRAGKIRGATLGSAAVAAVIAAMVGYGHARVVSAAAPPRAPIRVAVAQANIDLGASWNDELYGRNLDVYLTLTAESLRSTAAQLVVWPENAMTFFIEHEPRYREAIARVLRPRSAELVAGGVHAENAEGSVYYNSVFAIAPDGSVAARYDKEHLLPLAEYFPFPAIDLLRRNFGRVREFSPGPPTPPLPTRAGAAGVLICNEALFPEPARARVRAGARILLNLSNDSWMNDRKFSAIAFDMSALRAVEQRRYLVRASTSGPSAIVDPLGRVRARSKLFERAAIDGSVEPLSGLTLYARVGDAFAAMCVVATLAGMLWASRASRRTRQS